MKTRRKYSREFKIEAVRMANEPGITLKQIGAELGVNPHLLCKWREQMQEGGELQALPGQGKPRDEEMAALRRELRYEGETASLNRVARLMRNANIQGILQRRRWRAKRPAKRPIDVRNHLDRDFSAQHPNTKWSTDITYVRTAENWLYLCVVLDLYSGQSVGWSMRRRQDRQLVIQAVLMAFWQRTESTPVILHSDRGCQFTSDEYQRFLKGHNLVCSMSAVGSGADNAAVEGFFGLLQRERVNRRQYRNRAKARADIFDYIERFHNPLKQRELDGLNQGRTTRPKPSVMSG